MKIRIVPAVIATVFGVCFLAAELRFNYYPVISESSFDTPEERKARAAVTALLLDPESASIGELRTVRPHGVLYVCGRVNGKDRAKSYAGFRDFVYEVAGDFATIDRDDEIARSHRTFRPCPVEDKPKAIVIDLDKLNKIAKALPKPDVQIAGSFPSPAGGGGSANGAGNSQDLRQGIEGLRPNVQQGARQSSSTESSSMPQSRAGGVSPTDESNGVATNPRQAGRNLRRAIRYQNPKPLLLTMTRWNLRLIPNAVGSATRTANRQAGPRSRRSRRRCGLS